MKRFQIPVLLVLMILFTVSPGSGQADQTAGNPCSMKAQNPCGEKAANPCAGKAAAMDGAPAINPCFAKAGVIFTVADPMRRNTVTFRSEAPLEDIVGTSNEVHGYIVFDPDEPQKGGKAEIVVPVASLRTGIPLRDEHLRDTPWLDASSHEFIRYRVDALDEVEYVKEGDGFVTWRLRARGQFTLRGITRELESPVTLTYLSESLQTREKMEGNLLAARAAFTVALADYGIEGFAGVVGSKVGQAIEIDVSLMATDAAAVESNGAMNSGAGETAAREAARSGR